MKTHYTVDIWTGTQWEEFTTHWTWWGAYLRMRWTHKRAELHSRDIRIDRRPK